MDEEDIRLFREVAFLDRQLQIGTSTAEEEDIDTRLRKQLAPTCPETETGDSLPDEQTRLMTLNVRVQAKLKKIHKRLLHLIAENERRQEVLSKCLKQLKSEHATYAEPSESNYSLAVVKCIGIPYFKDEDGFPQPQNDDVKNRLANGQLLCMDYFMAPHPWNKQDKEKLRLAVSSELEKQSQTINFESGGVEGNASNRQINSHKRPIDWLKISATDLNGKYSSTECESMWRLDLAPEVNHKQWSLKEIENLKVIALKYNLQNWNCIASELNTGRNGYQCCVKYQMKNSLSEGKWSNKEDNLLRKLVNKFKFGNKIHWGKVVWFFETRSRKQCVERYYSHLQKDLKKGYFSPAEDKIIIYGVRLLHNFGELARFLPGRVAGQIRSRYYYLVGTTMPEFTEHEDKLLMELVEKYPGKWLQISESFLNRSSVQCRLRYSTLIKKDFPKPLCNAIQRVWTEYEKGQGDGKVYPRKKRVTKREWTAYDHILDYHELCTENYFGPRHRTPRTDEELVQLSLKLRATMAMLSASSNLSKKTDLINSLELDCNFDPYDIKLLNQLSEEDKKGESAEFDYYNRGMLIPPNYTTLVGLETLMQSRLRVQERTCEAEGLIPTEFVAEEQQMLRLYPTDTCVSISRAEALFQKRLEILFSLPLFLMHVPTAELSSETFHKRKTRKPKQLSRKRRKAHAKSMYLAAVEAKRKRLEGMETTEDVEDVGDVEEGQGSNS